MSTGGNIFLAKPCNPGNRRGCGGFTLIEILVATTVLILLAVVLTNLSNVASKTWMEGEKRVEISQSGRAILDMMGRDLSGALAGPAWQFVQNPTLPALTPAVASNTDSLFWQATSKQNASGNVAVVGYFVVRDTSSNTYELRRLFIEPGNPLYPALGGRTSATTATWISNMNTSAFDIAASAPTCSTMAEGVVAMWIQSFDAAGTPIPWWVGSVASTGSEKFKFNSSATFQSGDGTSAALPSAFNYTSVSAPYMPRGDKLPAFVEVSIVIVDSTTIKRGVTIPAPPVVAAPGDVAAQISAYRQTLVDAGITSSRVFSTRFPTKNAPL